MTPLNATADTCASAEGFVFPASSGVKATCTPSLPGTGNIVDRDGSQSTFKTAAIYFSWNNPIPNYNRAVRVDLTASLLTVCGLTSSGSGASDHARITFEVRWTILGSPLFQHSGGISATWPNWHGPMITAQTVDGTTFTQTNTLWTGAAGAAPAQSLIHMELAAPSTADYFLPGGGAASRFDPNVITLDMLEVFLTIYYDALPSCTLVATPPSIVAGQTATLSWTTNDATSAILTPPTRTVALAGSASVSPITTTTYSLIADNTDGSSVCDVILVVAPGEALPTCFISSSSTLIIAGGSVTITWVSTNADSASLQVGAGSPAAVSPNGSQVFTPAVTTNYILSVANATGTGTCSVTVVVEGEPPPPPPPVPGTRSVCPPTLPPAPGPSCAIVANPPSTNPGQATTLNWISSNATTAKLRGSGSVPLAGTKVVSPRTTTRYTLDVTGPGGDGSCFALVTVVPPTKFIPYLVIPGGQGQTTTELDGHSSVAQQDIDCIDKRGELKFMAADPRAVGTIARFKMGFEGECLSDFQVMHTTQLTEVGWTTDGMVKFVCQELQRTLFEDAWLLGGPFPRWMPGSYRSGDRVLDANGNFQLVLVGGQTGLDEPMWMQAINALTYDGAPSGAPSCTISASATVIGPGESVTISWNATGADTATLQAGAAAPVSVGITGSQVFTPTITTVYTLVSTSSTGSSACSVTVVFGPGTPTVGLGTSGTEIIWQNIGPEAQPPGPCFSPNGDQIGDKNPRWLQGNPIDILLVCCQNEIGIGQDPNLDPSQWRMYVPGLPSTLINPNFFLDVDRLLELRDHDFSGDRFEFKLTSSQTAKSWVEDQILKPLGLYSIVRPDGKLTFKSMKSPGISRVLSAATRVPMTFYPSSAVDAPLGGSPFAAPSMVWDGDQTTASVGNAVSTLDTRSEEWGGFGSTAGINSIGVTLGILAMSIDQLGIGGTAYMEYSVDGGFTWTELWNDPDHHNGTTGPIWSFVALPDGFDCSLLVVRAFCSVPAGIPDLEMLRVYEISVSASVLPVGNALGNNSVVGTLTDNEIIGIPEVGRWPVINHVTVRLEVDNSGPNTSSKTYTSDLTFEQEVSADQFQQVFKTQIEANGFRLGWGGAQRAWIIADRIFRRHAFATPEYRFETFLKDCVYEVGDFVLLTHRLLPNYSDPQLTLGVQDLLVEIVDKQPHYDKGTMEYSVADCRFMGVTLPYQIAPTGASSWDVATAVERATYLYVASVDGTNPDGSAANTIA